MCIVHVAGGEAAALDTLRTKGLTEDERIKLLEDHEVSVLVCGGIECGLSDELKSLGIDVIHNVVGETEEVFEHLARGELRPGHGITHPPRIQPGTGRRAGRGAGDASPPSPFEALIDCVRCSSQTCRAGGVCPRPSGRASADIPGHVLREAMEVAWDIAAEPERVLCRIAELVHFCRGLKWERLGLAFCTDLFSEAEKVAGLLGRYFHVIPVCCRIGGPVADDGASPDSLPGPDCDPFAQARVLNEAGTDLNVTLGLCMGCDVIFARVSRAPVSTLFVKDRLLANNPVSAVHSKFVLDHLLSGAGS